MAVFKPEGLLIDTFENKMALKNVSSLQEACQSGKILEARAMVCDSSHNLIVDLGCMKAIIPKNEGAIGIEEGIVRDIAIISRVNKPVCFKIIGFEKRDGTDMAVLSRKAVQQQCMREFVSALTPGDVLDARVTHLEPFGCFVDIACGISSLIPINAISISRIAHPRDRFRPDQLIRAVVKSVEEGGRITLSHKELLGSWEENAALFENGETVAGIIRSVEDYGIFVELTPNLAGLAEPREGIFPGQQASVYIKSLIPEKMKVKLIIVDAFEARYEPPTPTYFGNLNHMDYWKYSPDCSDRLIDTTFQ